jgi:hypothetical protein
VDVVEVVDVVVEVVAGGADVLVVLVLVVLVLVVLVLLVVVVVVLRRVLDVVEVLVLDVLVLVLVVELLLVVDVVGGPAATGVSRSAAISAALSARPYTRTSSIRPGNASSDRPIPIRSCSALAANEVVSVAASRSTPSTYSRTLLAASLYTAATWVHVPATRFTPFVVWSRHTPALENPKATSSPNNPR